MESEISSRTLSLSNRCYDFFKKIVTIYLPGAGALYFSLSTIWDFPYGEEVVGTLAALALFLGLGLKVSNTSYIKQEGAFATAGFDGAFVATPNGDGAKGYTLEFNGALEDLEAKKYVKLEVQAKDAESQ